MHRVELKAPLEGQRGQARRPQCEFLMHRVELKAPCSTYLTISFIVPNAPCGVERSDIMRDDLLD